MFGSARIGARELRLERWFARPERMSARVVHVMLRELVQGTRRAGDDKQGAWAGTHNGRGAVMG